MEPILAFDLHRQVESLRAEIEAAMDRILVKGNFILGEEVSAFEREFADFCGASFALGVGSGTDALHLALRACGVGAGDEVIAPSHTAVATVAAIEMTGAHPVLVDIDPDRFTLDPEKVETAITPRTRAIVPVHLYGCPADMDVLLKVAHAENIRIVEDASQAHGATLNGRRVGSLGDIAAFSFYPTKNLGAFGDGGAVVTSDPELAERVRLLRQYGWEHRYVSKVKGFNSRLDEIQAGILRIKLRRLDSWNTRRREIAGLYFRLLSDPAITLPMIPANAVHVFHQFVLRCPHRNELREFLTRQGIQTLVHYPVPVHLQPGYADLGLVRGGLPRSERAADEVLSLPVFPELTWEEALRVAEGVNSFSWMGK